MVARARRNVISHCMSCDDVSAAKAVSYTPRRPVERRMLDRYARTGVIVPTKGSACYIDVASNDSYSNSRRRNVGVAMALLAQVGGAVVGMMG